jgi:hypothetical protein
MSKDQIQSMSNVQALSYFFGGDRKVDMPEMMALSADERQVLGDQIRAHLISCL